MSNSSPGSPKRWVPGAGRVYVLDQHGNVLRVIKDLTGVTGLGPGLPDHRPGCGSRSVEPGVEEALERRYGGRRLTARRVELADLEDDFEAMHDRGWTDGLPVVPPTEALRAWVSESASPASSTPTTAPAVGRMNVETASQVEST